MTESSQEGRSGVRVLQRVVFPEDRDLDVMPLYVEGWAAAGSGPSQQTPPMRISGEDFEPDAVTKDASAEDSDDSGSSYGDTATSRNVTGRRSAVIPAGRRLSFGTYFNGFPASYWRRWTTVSDVTLRVRLQGDATVIVYRSTARGHTMREDSRHVVSEEPVDLHFNLSLKPFIDGGWYWFDIAAGGGDVALEEADWSTVTDRLEHGRVTLAITTFNRPEFCVAQLENLGQAGDVLAVTDEIVVVDQGTNRVTDDPDYADAAKRLGARLRVIEQGNIGGSGGFSRGMAEAARPGGSDYALLLDDDVITETEGILRAVTFADMARRPTIVGGQMFSLSARSVLHAYGETVNRYRFFWGVAPGTLMAHDLAKQSLRRTSWMHRRIDVDYNGWWMCLIPTAVVRELGLSLPMFIKWDDCEYGLRAGEAGYPTASLPGVAVWHVPWHEKDDSLDWQAYFHERNRLICALLHSPYPFGGRLLRESALVVVKHLISMQYSTVELILLAIEDLLAGPDQLHPDIITKMGQLRSVRAQFPDAQTKNDLEAYPSPRRRKPPRRGKEPTAPRGSVGRVKAAALGAVRQALPVREAALARPEAAVPHLSQRWWLLSQFDSALVSSADGMSAAWYRRNPQRFRALFARSAALHSQLLHEWPQLREGYRGAVPELTSPERWRTTFEASKPT
jgi:galactofuranosylgalactofuranosylrhamnosyl-N-acetylglucosaminyl-diphospho-decaprenol beta-1,5/1,6-galactofuranosyltransferase